MTLVDWTIVVLAVALMLLGYRRGFLVGFLSLTGFALGALLGSRVGPLVLAQGDASPYAPLGALAGGLLIGGAFAIGLEALGVNLRPRIVRSNVGERVDAVLGAFVLALLGLAVAWVIGAVVLSAPNLHRYRPDVERSVILSALNDALPPTGPLLNVLKSINDLPTLRGPSADVQPPRRGILADPEFQTAGNSVVRILGSACGFNVSGSGWVAGPGLVVTNAHVVAGESDTVVATRGGDTFDTRLVLFRPRDDIAILEVEGLDLEPLPLVDSPRSGISGGVAGYPGTGQFATTPARLGTTGEVSSQDAYGRGPIERRMTSFRADVQSGNSGGAP